MLNGNDLRSKPLIFRKAMLERILKESPLIRYTDHVVGEGKQLFSTVAKLGLEGIVGKKADSLYWRANERLVEDHETGAGTAVMKNELRLGGDDSFI